MRFLAVVVMGLLLGSAGTGRPAAPEEERPPNFVLIYADDLGYGDLGCYGAKEDPTPNLDRMARQGVRFTDFYVAQAVCSASRTALLTGCYPNRLGILGALGPQAQIGINSQETTLAEVLKTRGYATAIYGKWHLGHRPPFLPTRHGFDEYFGLPYSNDMGQKPAAPNNPPLPLIDGDRVVQTNPDQGQLTRWYTEHAVGFILRNRDRPFFLYVPHTMPHVPLHVSAGFEGRTKRGLYADVLAEVDDSVGQILTAVRTQGLDRRTLVMFISDNGPWLSYGNHAGTAGPLREGKGTTFEGGVREPFIARWPGRIPPGTVCREPAMTIDILPTLAGLAGARAPADRVIDGRDIWPLLEGKPGVHSPHEVLYFYWGNGLEALRSGRWKLHLPHEYRSLAGTPGRDGRPDGYQTGQIELSLFDLESDPGEKTNVASQHPDVVQRMQSLAEQARDDLGDSLTGRRGKNLRPPGRVAAGG